MLCNYFSGTASSHLIIQFSSRCSVERSLQSVYDLTIVLSAYAEDMTSTWRCASKSPEHRDITPLILSSLLMLLTTPFHHLLRRSPVVTWPKLPPFDPSPLPHPAALSSG